MSIELEGFKATQILKGKIVESVVRSRVKEILIQFTDGTRLFIDHQIDGLELSITGGKEDLDTLDTVGSK